MVIIREMWLMMLRELRKNLRSAKGIVLGVLALVGGVLSTLIVISANRLSDDSPGLRETASGFEHKTLAGWVLNDETGRTLSQAPGSLLLLMMIGVTLAPSFVALVGYDALAADQQHRTVRYWTLRVTRNSIYFGKLAGLFATTALVYLVLNVACALLTIVKTRYGVGETFEWASRLWLSQLPILFAWCALTVFISSVLKSPMLALFLTFGANFILWVIKIVGLRYWAIEKVQHRDESLKNMVFLYPNSLDGYTMSANLSQVAIGVAGCVAFAAVFTVIGSMLFAKRDL